MHYKFLIRPQSVIYDVIDSEAVVMDLEAGIYFSFNISATKIWLEIISGHLTDNEVYEYATHQNRNFIDFLLEQNIIFRELSPKSGNVNKKKPMDDLEVAEWQTFSDMKELLLLDPVHDIALNEQGWPENRKG
jgi:hypothetical protein